MIIAFGHRKRVGKDTAAKFLDSFLRVERPGLKVKKVSFAGKLKDICYQLYGWAGLQPGIFYETEVGQKIKEVLLPKIGKSPRDVWITVGNKMREVYAETWIDHALQGTSADVIIISDLRFPNEATRIHELDGLICKINRNGLEQGSDPAETSLINWFEWDRVIENNGTLSDLNAQMEIIGREILCG